MRRAALVLVTLAAGCRRDEGPFVNRNADWARCRHDSVFRTYELATFDHQHTIAVEFAGDGVDACGGPHQPVIEARLDPSTRWVQIIDVNVPVPSGVRDDPTWALRSPVDDWMFLDCSEDNREHRRPLYNDLADFFDNPAWGPPAADQREGQRTWRAHTYAVEVRGNEVRALGGIAWGMGWRVGTAAPFAIAPTALGRDAWAADARALAPVTPDWRLAR